MMNWWILYLMFYVAFSQENFSVTWRADLGAGVEGYYVYVERLGRVEKIKVYGAKTTFVALQRSLGPVQIFVTAYSGGGTIESLPSRVVEWPFISWVWWTPLLPWKLQESSDLLTWRDSPVVLFYFGPFGGINTGRLGVAKFFRLKLNISETPL
jgi:hypothetical protein